MAPRKTREGEEDFEAFWAQHRAKEATEYKVIFGVRVAVPTDMPLSLEDTIDQLADSAQAEDLERVLEVLFGQDVMAAWKTAGCTAKQLRVLMAWGMANANGKPTTFAEAVQLAAQAEEHSNRGKAAVPNRTARRASSRTH